VVSSTIFKNSIANSGELQVDYLVCKFLHKTPAEIRELEKQGLLTFEQKVFIAAGIAWDSEVHPSFCPFMR
jgi:hypothetical protein